LFISILSGIAYDDDVSLDKVSCGTSFNHLKECAHHVAQEIDASLKTTEDARLAMAQRAIRVCNGIVHISI
jgi:hypothetical protein